ncbi:MULTISPECIES: winged helix DNA-binding domain-containing protein [unclassified Streptomyces]|uniref:winged helix DNA-binding domain-containing protein n=1 Tax=unclassified Streptomyces TaxID=2593676 RepID=UPI00036ABC60|nr:MULTISPECIES: winged helix DNA-binding domain-containing protein [unclassified Streptomyces]MYT32932.1 winged helix DNA-binding domain-containing protein [Streptomyces sp. SID8354]
MSAVPRITDAQRRARLVRRQLPGPGRRSAATSQVAESVLALHATDAATVYLSAAARLENPRYDTIERELYERESLLRMTAMRCTLFVVPTALAPVMLAAVGRPNAAARTKGLLRQLEENGYGDASWLEGVTRSTLEAVGERGEATTAELAAAVPGLDRQLVVSPGKRYESRRSIATDLLFALAADGHLVRGSRRGGWTSNQHAWTLAPELPDIPAPVARAELVRHWLGAFGPGTVADLKWWTGWTVTETRKALTAAGAVEVALDAGTGYALPEDVEDLEAPVAAGPEPTAALLPALDPTPMGWRERGFYLDPEHVPALFDRMGNIGPTVWWDGRIVGGWAQRKDGALVWRLLTDPGREARTAIEDEVDRTTAFFGERRFTPAYRTPLERELES